MSLCIMPCSMAQSSTHKPPSKRTGMSLRVTPYLLRVRAETHISLLSVGTYMIRVRNKAIRVLLRHYTYWHHLCTFSSFFSTFLFWPDFVSDSWSLVLSYLHSKHYIYQKCKNSPEKPKPRKYYHDTSWLKNSRIQITILQFTCVFCRINGEISSLNGD